MLENNKPKRIKPKNTEISEFDFLICPNCGEEEVGKFCPSCGQSNKDYNKPMKEIFQDLLDSINLDIRLFNSLVPFFTKPGFLAEEYFKGRRKKYVPPLRMYMFFSLLFFLLLQWTSDKTLKEENNGETNTNIGANLNVNGASLALADNINDSVFLVEPLVLDSIKTDSVKKRSTNIINISDEERKKIDEELMKDSTISDGVKQVVKGGLNASENQQLFADRFYKYLSYTLFLLMPLFALILAMILWKSKMLYVNHLIFSINFHSFIFGLGSIVILLVEILPDNYTSNVLYLFFGVPLYLMFGIKQFYKRGYIGAFFKMFGALLIYNFIICMALLGVVVLTAYNLSYL